MPASRAQDPERAGAGQRTAPGVQEQLLPVPAVEVRPPAREVAAQGGDRGATDRHDALLAALADHAHEPVVEVDARLVESDGLRDTQPCAVEQLHERLVAQRPRLRPGGGVDQPFCLAGRERLGQWLGAPGQLDARGRVVVARAEQLLVAVEAARGRGASRDRRTGEAVGAELGGVALQLLERRLRGRLAEVGAERREVAPVGVDGARRPLRGEQGEKAVDVGIALHRPRFAAAPPEPVRAGAPFEHGAPVDNDWQRIHTARCTFTARGCHLTCPGGQCL